MGVSVCKTKAQRFNVMHLKMRASLPEWLNISTINKMIKFVKKEIHFYCLMEK